MSVIRTAQGGGAINLSLPASFTGISKKVVIIRFFCCERFHGPMACSHKYYIVLPHRSPLYEVVVGGNSSNVNLKGGGRQPTLQPLLQEGQYSSDATSPGVLAVRGTPFDKQAPLQRIGPSCGRCSF